MSRSPLSGLQILRLALIALVLAALGLIAAGCRPAHPPAVALAELERLGKMLDQVEIATPVVARDLRHKWEDELRSAQSQRERNPTREAILQFAIAYAFEREEQYREAAAAYGQLEKSPLRVPASFRRGEVMLLGLRERKEAITCYTQAAAALPGTRLWLRSAPEADLPLVAGRTRWPSVLASALHGRLRLAPAMPESQLRLDLLRRDDWRYRAISALVRALGNNRRYSYGLALLLIAVIVKLVTTPLTSSSFRSIRAMQSLQPLIKGLQEKHKGDRQALAAEQMRLFKRYKINPLGGCLPMLIQIPILFAVYQGIQIYIYQLREASFLWIRSLAEADMPLLLMYALSLYFSQKLTSMPQADPQQQQMQNTMTIMMPLMLTVLFASLPAAFILYWFFYNILITAHQWHMMRQPAPALAPAPESPARGPGRSRPRRR